jgi:hypothetical protein
MGIKLLFHFGFLRAKIVLLLFPNCLSKECYMSARLKIFGAFLSVLLVALAAIDCSRKAGNQHHGDEVMPQRPIETVLKEYTNELMAMPGVVGTAQGLCDDKPCIKVYVTELTPELEQKIPKNLEGYLVDVEATGEFRALPKK